MLPLILASGFFADWASAWASNLGGIVLVVIGMILIVVEMLIPGFGAAGVSGGVALIAGLIIGSNSLTGAMFSLLIVVILLAVFATIIFRSALHGKLSRSPVVLNTSLDSNLHRFLGGRFVTRSRCCRCRSCSLSHRCYYLRGPSVWR